MDVGTTGTAVKILWSHPTQNLFFRSLFREGERDQPRDFVVENHDREREENTWR